MTREEEFNQWLKSYPPQSGEQFTRVDELLIYQNRATARTEDLLARNEDLLRAIAAAGGIVIPSGPTEDRSLVLARAQLLSDPEGVCALVNSHQPNLCRGAAIGFMATIGAGATTAVSSEVRAGFVWVVTNVEFYTDVPFAIHTAILRDGVLLLIDAGVVPSSARFRNWTAGTLRWECLFTNGSAVDVNIHVCFAGWEVEVGTFRSIMAMLEPLSFAISEHGTPEVAAK